jgi:hypothetical protein
MSLLIVKVYLERRKVMSKKHLSDAEKWRRHQAEELLKSIIEVVEFDDLGVKLLAGHSQSTMECKTCGTRWDVGAGESEKGYKCRLFILDADDNYRVFFHCPKGCNENKRIDGGNLD